MHGSRSKIPSKILVRQRCAKGFNSGVIGLTPQICKWLVEIRLYKLMSMDASSMDEEAMQNEHISVVFRW
jgi:hypothetical protein